jgi:hypothetical protein
LAVLALWHGTANHRHQRRTNIVATTQKSDPRANGRIEERAMPAGRTKITPEQVADAIGLYRFHMQLAQQVLDGEITPAVCLAVTAATGRALQAIDMQYRLGNKRLADITPKELKD